MSKQQTPEEQIHSIYQKLCDVEESQPHRLLTIIRDIPTQYLFNVLAEAIRAKNPRKGE